MDALKPCCNTFLQLPYRLQITDHPKNCRSFLLSSTILYRPYAVKKASEDSKNWSTAIYCVVPELPRSHRFDPGSEDPNNRRQTIATTSRQTNPRSTDPGGTRQRYHLMTPSFGLRLRDYRLQTS
ncbi:hypothetical protein F2Q70_00040534 [Brassica cretica]|uniref:Uncharacterized protein n=1 Tax=Brassica cretica TaxID=69181 RepID=A0A8S9KAM3_BRACR|nr:hypothetical protein F2Q70_00040534 [Brassica cretica]KAF2619305.1 hypothetical protein F2Q68_00041182 [Brassica cretica]